MADNKSTDSSIKNYLQLKAEFEETYSKFIKAVEDYKELWEKFYRPSSSHRGSPTWRDSGDIEITEFADESIYYLVGIEVSCCGDYAYGTYRWCPEYVFYNPTKENLDILLNICVVEDERLRLEAVAKKKKEKEEREKEVEERERKELKRLKEKYES